MKWLKSLTACRWGVALLLLLAVMFLAVSTSSAAGAWKQKFSRFSAVAGETLVTGNVVCIKSSDAKAYKADADDATLWPAVGVIGKGGATGSTVEIVLSGILGRQTNAANGTTLYLSGTAGVITASPPTGGNQTLGFALKDQVVGSTTYSDYLIIVTPPGPDVQAP